MTHYPFLQVDAFTERPLQGNACAVILDADGLDDVAMAGIAREMNLSETAFVFSGDDRADFQVRFFTPAVEIPLAGHPTLAVARALVDTERFPLQGDRTTLRLRLQVGVISVTLHAAGGQLTQVTMHQPRPTFGQVFDPMMIAPLVGLSADDLIETPPQVVSTGTPQLMVGLRHLDALRSANLDQAGFRAFRDEHAFMSVHLFHQPGLRRGAGTFARHLDVPPDLVEDPFTGSATGAMAAYLWHHRLLTEANFIAQQGHWMDRPGEAKVTVQGTPTDIKGIDVAGATCTVLQGELRL